ncbi:LIN41-like protein [Mya arenaria]|uniref:LIN41-like protein n=1 Tax=Mya arenaria TaxID=6604 RepID=A0ABY7ELW1_MYAAR|nr:E3 ubiquitin-protein ligase TRIM71-like [Mya arenaria]WAR10978.1 LIN41-like protein [Mya arenaria]
MTAQLVSPRAAHARNLRENEEAVECSLCLKNFTKPKILPCFHSFCLKCLQDYVETNAHNQKFACPLCACECVIPSSGVDELQTNFYIKAAQTKLKIAANSPCEVCDDGSRAERSCIECEQNLCTNCSRGHLKMKSSRDHHLVSLTEKSHAGEGQVTSKSFCEKHKGDELSFYCRKCSVPICLRCKVTVHEQHTTEDLADVAAEIRVLLMDMLKGAQGMLPKFHSHLNDITFYNDHLEKEREKLKDEIISQTKKLHEKVDDLCRKMMADVEDEYCVEVARLGTRRHMISDRTTSFSTQLHSANQVVCYGSDADIAWNRDNLAEQLQKMASLVTPSDMIHLKMDFIPSDDVTSAGVGDLIGALKKIRDPTENFKVEEFSAFSVDNSFKAVNSVCPADDGSAWIALGWTADAHLFYRHGVKVKTQVVSRTIDCIGRDGETLIMSSNEQKVVGKPGPGFNLDDFATFPGYNPRGLAVTPNGDVLICLAQSAAFQDYRPNHRNKVVRLNSAGKMINEYGADGKLFMYPLRVAVNVNGDICVSDCRKQKVIIVKKTGELKTEYNGSPGEEERRFEPRGIACDARGHIFVADGAGHAIHMLDHTGRFMRHVVTEDQGLFGPYSVAVDRDDYLWVGCRDADIKVYKLNWT